MNGTANFGTLCSLDILQSVYMLSVVSVSANECECACIYFFFTLSLLNILNECLKFILKPLKISRKKNHAKNMN